VDRSEIIRAIESAQRDGELSINDAQFDELPSSIREITNLKILKIRNCSLRTLPAWLANMTSLEVLDLDGNNLESFPPVIASLRSLRLLGLSDNQVDELPSTISNMVNLAALVLPGNKIRELPSSIGALKTLRILDLGRNSLSALPESVGSLEELTHLYLWGNSFLEIPDALRPLGNLEVIEFSSVGINDRRDSRTRDYDSPSVGLTRLVGSGTDHKERLKKIPDWLPLTFKNLRALYLGGQDISALPEAFAAMTQLRALFLANNKIEAFPKAILALKGLDELDLRSNRIRDLPTDLAQLRKLSYLDLAKNPLPIPPEVLERPHDPSAIIDYAGRISQATRPLNEAKLLIVGEGSVGKTSLVKRLTQDAYDENENKTEGIDVTCWESLPGEHNITLNVWDFGGQEIMHATHQFFLTKRSIYVLVIDARQGEEQNRIEYWLKLIQSFSDHSPVIIVSNKSDQAKLDIDQRGLKAKYQNIIGIVSVSCRTGAGVSGVKRVLARAVDQLPNVRDLVPMAFFDVKRRLDQLDANYLSFADYEQLCRDNGILSKGSQELLIKLLHDLGTVLCFRDDPRLADTNILNPAWVTGGVYRLLNSNLAAQRKGLLSWPDINQILESDDYPMERRAFIVEMMKKFELCFESDGDFLIPDLLTKEEPDTGTWNDVLHFEVKYDVLPSSIISRLIVRMKALISKGTAWRTGVVLRLDRNRALVKGDREDSVVTIDISGPQNRRRELLTVIRSELRAIERTIPGLASEERVPIPGQPGIWVPYSHLLDLEMAGETTVIPHGLTTKFAIKELFGGVETPETREGGQLVPPRNVRSAKSNARPGSADAPPWTVRQSMTLGFFLLCAVIIVLAASVVTYKFVNPAAAAAAGVLALVVSVVVGLFILRTSGRISEQGLLNGIKQALARVGHSDGSKPSGQG
jgi:internalin A